MFEQEVQRTLDYVARGIGVRIDGAPGSGRTTILQEVVKRLEKTGGTVYMFAGLRTHRNIAFAGVHGLGLDIRLGIRGVLGAADALTAYLSKPGQHVLMVDDIEYVDNESLAVIEAVLLRTKRPLVVTVDDSKLYSKAQLRVLSRGPGAQVQLNPLRYGQVNELIRHTLGAAADADATARILTKSAGNPRLVVRIAETASLSNLMALRDGQWQLTGDSLWNDHLRGTVEALLEGLNAAELTALQTMAIVGTSPIEVLQKVIHSNVLETLERRGFVSVMEDHHGCTSAAISPPVLADYFRASGLSGGRQVLRNRIARALRTLPPHPLGDQSAADSFRSALNALHGERSTNDAASTRHFHEQIQVREQALYRLWEAEKSVSSAVAFLRVHWGTPIDELRIERVFSQTRTADGDPGDLLFLAMTNALWTIYSGQGVAAAVSTLRRFGTEHPGWEADAEASALFLTASYDRMPRDLDAAMARLKLTPGEGGVANIVWGMLDLYRFNPSGALEAINSAKGFAVFPRMEPFIRGTALFVSGRIEEALTFALEWRSESRRNLDQFGVVASSYIAAQALVYCGYFDEAEYLMGSVFAMGRPGFLVDSLHDAMLRLAGLRSATTANLPRTTLAAQSRRRAPQVGPLPGIGRGVYDLIAERPIQPEGFDRRAARLIERQLDHGYVLEAAFSALFSTCLLPGRRVLELLRRIMRVSGTASYDQLVSIAGAVVEGDHQLLGLLLKHYEPDAHTYQVGMLLRGASKRHLLLGDSRAAEAMDQAFAAFTARFPPNSEILAFNVPGHLQLTVREIEISALAGHRTNTEIAEHLGISTRTVENHISNALRKTGATSRSALFDLVRNSYAAK
ncbi:MULTISPECIES: helix-turn-helix transcriptional regulator [unclassified Pseudarthrobacter]|uniref:helix-turn-helix transcriptional regulator n=1 Tax=unclassified Pseudarthrobacter TaxID=2647000 RepID=UPI003076F3FA